MMRNVKVSASMLVAARLVGSVPSGRSSFYFVLIVRDQSQQVSKFAEGRL
jgi:hypothetical protein